MGAGMVSSAHWPGGPARVASVARTSSGSGGSTRSSGCSTGWVVGVLEMEGGVWWQSVLSGGWGLRLVNVRDQ